MLLENHRCSAVLIAAILMLGNVPALAYSRTATYSYTKLTHDAQYLFVMISPRSAEHDGAGSNSSIRQGIRKIRDTYTRSGLYRNDGSTIPLWTVNWYAFGIEPLSDGVHLVRKGPWAIPYNYYDAEAVTFFAKDKLIRSYTVSDLVADPADLPDYTLPDCQHLNDQDKTYTIITNHGEYYLFDVTTGKTITVRDLVAVPAGMPPSSSPFLWRKCQRLNDRDITYTFIRKHGEPYLFDMITGKTITADDLIADPASMPYFSSHFMWRDCQEIFDQDDSNTIIVMSYDEHCLIDRTTCKTISCDNTTSGILSSFLRHRWILSVVFIIALGAVGYYWWQQRKHFA